MSASNNDSRICYNNHTHIHAHTTHTQRSATRVVRTVRRNFYEIVVVVVVGTSWRHFLYPSAVENGQKGYTNIVKMYVTGRRRRDRPPKVKPDFEFLLYL